MACQHDFDDLDQIRAHMDTAEDCDDATDMPCWPSDAVWSDCDHTVWSWDFRGEDGLVPAGECEGKALIGYDGSYNDGGAIVAARLSAPNAKSVRFVTIGE